MYFIYLKDAFPHFNYCETRMYLELVLNLQSLLPVHCSYLVVIPDNMIEWSHQFQAIHHLRTVFQVGTVLLFNHSVDTLGKIMAGLSSLEEKPRDNSRASPG